MQDRSDAEIIATILQGDVEAYGVLVERYRDRYARYATRMLGNRDEADEALQGAFVRAYRALPKCADPSRFGAWLHQIVVNECRTYGRRRGDRARRFVGDVEAMASASVDHPESDQALGDAIERALARLEPDQREAFLLKHVEDLSYEEMSRITGAGVSALKMRVKRACERLREMLGELRDD
jgi:RNA polymerase sigma-70 factor (ECF subfamily)